VNERLAVMAMVCLPIFIWDGQNERHFGGGLFCLAAL
jgi:hypothetical protein